MLDPLRLAEVRVLPRRDIACGKHVPSRPEVIVAHHAVRHVEPGSLQPLDVRMCSDSHDDEVGGNGGPIGEPHTLDPIDALEPVHADTGDHLHSVVEMCRQVRLGEGGAEAGHRLGQRLDDGRIETERPRARLDLATK
jgi:hypothetical protein